MMMDAGICTDGVRWAEAQRCFFEQGLTRDYAFRIAQLKRLRTMILSHQDEIHAALAHDLNKPLFEAFGSETGVLLAEIRHTLRWLRYWMRPRRQNASLLLWPAVARIHPAPKGVVLIISPWNYPFQLLMAPLIGALAAGNCAILKPSEKTPRTAALVERLVGEYFPAELVKVVTGDGSLVVPELMQNFRFDHVFFTGSPQVGAAIMRMASDKLVPVTLELGGKSPAIVDASTNLAIAARRIAFGKFFNAGQTCIAPDHVWVEESVAEPFLQALKAVILEFYGEDPLNSPDLASLVDAGHFRRVAAMLHDGDVVFGGRFQEDQRRIEPTIVLHPKPDSRLRSEEIFGPILPILTYRSEEDLLAGLRQHMNPLATYIFSERKDFRKWLLDRWNFGGGCINQTLLQLLHPELPFGGIGKSGQGHYHGEASFKTFSHERSVLHGSLFPDIRLWFPPYQPWKLKLGRWFLK